MAAYTTETITPKYHDALVAWQKKNFPELEHLEKNWSTHYNQTPFQLFAKIGKLTLPVLAIGGDHSYGASMKTEFGYVASNVEGAVIENSGHWIMEEQPQQAIRAIVAFIEKQ